MYMKQMFTRLFVMTSAIIIFSGCEKIKDIFPKPKTDIVDCRILDLGSVRETNSYSVGGTISYNAQGNPVSVTGRGGGTGTTNRKFEYDSLNRLIHYAEIFYNGIAETGHRYSYDRSGKVITDSIYTMYGISGRLILELDEKGRVIKTTSTGPYPGMTVTTYNYDERGNLVMPGVVYDDQVNMHRTNKVFQLIDLDYSRNNPFIADAYNKTGLPTRIPVPPKASPEFLNIPIRGHTITYSCE
jgi:YD repeat-containing protein